MTSYKNLGSLLEYPQSDFYNILEKIETESFNSEIKKVFFEFSKFAKKRTLEDLQELYTRTFDINPVSSLYASVHLFGEESFKRAELMAKLKEEYIKSNFDSGSELPDFIPVILKFVTHLKDDHKYNDLLSLCVIKPLNSILEKFNNDNPYRALVSFIRQVVKKSLDKELIHG